MKCCENDVRVKYYSTSNGESILVVRFYNDKKKVFTSEYVRMKAKGSRLYFMNGEHGNGLKMQENGCIGVTKYAQDFRKFEGEYSLMKDDKHYYVDLNHVKPLSTGGWENKHSYPSGTKRKNQKKSDFNEVIEVIEVKEEITENVVKSLDVTVIEALKNKALELLLEGATEDAGTIAQTIRILQR